jgi:hypothetical protein
MVWLLLAALGVPARVDGRSMNLTEATAVASHADAARLLGEGADPNARARLRAGLVKNAETMMTPLEAATGAIRTGPVKMLVEHGATIDQGNYTVLWCGARVAEQPGHAEISRITATAGADRLPHRTSVVVKCAKVGTNPLGWVGRGMLEWLRPCGDGQ